MSFHHGQANSSGHRGYGGRGGGGRGRGGRGGGRPQGLRGQEIGLYYAKKHSDKKKKLRSVLGLTEVQRDEVAGQITRIQSMAPLASTSSRGRQRGAASDLTGRLRRNIAANARREAGLRNGAERERHCWTDDIEESDQTIEVSSRESDHMLAEFQRKVDTAQYRENLSFRRKLPAYEMKDELASLIAQNQVVVISGETGCGKTTQVPQFVLDDLLHRGLGSQTKVICTQPRRISAISVAERVAEERAVSCGGADSTVGYQIRLESKLPREKGSILYCTTGCVLQWMRENPTLDGISHIILDEIHERDILSDFLITVLKDLLPERSDLKVVLMSATLNADLFSRYFFNCPKIEIPGFTFPVKEFYLEDVLEMTGFRIEDRESQAPAPKWHRFTSRGREKVARRDHYEDFIAPFVRDLESSGKYSRPTIMSLRSQQCEETNHELIASLVGYIDAREGEGAILVFLPGWEDISKVNKLLTEDSKYKLNRCRIYPLHSLMPTANQREIFLRPPRGLRKIVIATNIAETSITIDDVVFVVDCGKIKMSNFDVEANIATLKPEWVSLANARQRRGRAGRVQPGICYHLYTRAREMTLDQFVVPEMQRTRLEEVILQIKILELGKASSFLSRVLEAPSPESVALAIEMLKTLGALDEEEQLTPLGFHLAQLPLDPQTGKMVLLGAVFSCLDPVLSVAASLSFKDAFLVPLGQEAVVDDCKRELSRGTRSDHLMLANAISQWESATSRGRGRDFCWNFFLSESTLRMLDNMKRQFAEHLFQQRFLDSKNAKGAGANRNSGNEELVRAVICAGLYPNVASVKVKRTRTGGFPILQTAMERRVSVHPKSVNAKEVGFSHPWVVYHLKMRSASSTFIYDCSEVSPMALIFFGRHLRVGEDRLSDGEVIETVDVDDFVRFKCARETAAVFKVLRRSLDELLEYKVSNPGVTNWDRSTREGAILDTIVNLLSYEPVGDTVEEDFE